MQLHKVEVNDNDNDALNWRIQIAIRDLKGKFVLYSLVICPCGALLSCQCTDLKKKKKKLEKAWAEIFVLAQFSFNLLTRWRKPGFLYV